MALLNSNQGLSNSFLPDQLTRVVPIDILNHMKADRYFAQRLIDGFDLDALKSAPVNESFYGRIIAIIPGKTARLNVYTQHKSASQKPFHDRLKAKLVFNNRDAKAKGMSCTWEGLVIYVQSHSNRQKRASR